jgi:hypothetical protein
MLDITLEAPKLVTVSRLLLPDRMPDAVDWIILPAVKMEVVPAVLIPDVLVQPIASLVSSIKLITERAGTTTQLLQEFRGQRYNAHSQWGLNE